VTANQELFGGAALKLDPFGCPPAGRRVKIHVRGIGGAPGIGERRTERLLPFRRRGRARIEFNGAAVEKGRAIERQGAAGAQRRTRSLGGGLLPIARALVVLEQHVRIGGLPRHQCFHHRAMNPAGGPRGTCVASVPARS
jgi:hypothetical protein